MIVYEHALLYCWWPVCTVSSSDMLWRIVLFSTRISLFDTTVLTLLCRWRAGQGISYVYIPFTSLPLYYVYICLYTVFWDSSPHTRLYVWPAFCLFLLSMLTTLGCSPRAVQSQVLRWCIAGAGFGARSRLVDVYIYQLYILITWQACIFSMRCILRYYSVPIMYWLYITCFRSCISYCILYYLFCSCISWLLYFIPAMWDCCR